MARRDIEFDAEGVTLRGWFYVPEGASGPGPAVVMAHGFSAVKEMYLDSFAEVFAAGSRRPQAGRTDGPRPRLELIRAGTPGTAHARWRPAAGSDR